jgi:hypothetical protein
VSTQVTTPLPVMIKDATAPVPVRVSGSPLPVHITGTALPVRVMDQPPVRVDVGPPDSATLWLAWAAIAVSALAAFFGWRATLFAKKDWELTVERLKQIPEFTVSVQEQVGFTYHPDLVMVGPQDPVSCPLSLEILNNGRKKATEMALTLRTQSEDLQIRTDRGNAMRDQVSVLDDRRNNRSFISLNNWTLEVTEHAYFNVWTLVGNYGEHILYWQITSAEAAWPCLSNAPLSQWGQIKVTVQNGPTPQRPGIRTD